MIGLTMGDYEVDEALWDAYRHHDKSAVTANLLCRYLVEGTITREAKRSSGHSPQQRYLGIQPFPEHTPLSQSAS